MSELSENVERELAALADGSSTAEQRERALEQVRNSPELQEALAEQQQAVELLASVTVEAPAALHRRVEQMHARARDGTRRRGGAHKTSFARRRIGFAIVAAAALVVVAIAIGLSQGGSSGLSVQQTVALTLSPATMGAPSESKADRAQLAASVGGVAFPYWEEHFGWRGSGARSDQLAGHAITTVFYSNAKGQRIGYAIVSGRPPSARGGTLVRRWGVSYRLLEHGGATVVVWQRAGHLCVVSGRGVSAHVLLNLASWGEKPHVT